MESLSRPPHRRKHSCTSNASSSSFSFSIKNPYDDVMLSKSGKTKFEAHEYSEIFSGSSSIPVLDLSVLNEQVGSGDFRGSKLDYSNIFGGARDDDVVVPYQQLFNGSLKKTKTRNPADAESSFQEPRSLNNSGQTESSSVASDQSVDGIKQHFNVSFNKTSQRNNDEANGKTHIAHLHVVPGFAHFVDGTPHLLKKESDRPVPSMKREVSRTWSFSSGVETTTVEGGLSSEKSHILDKSCNVSGIKPKSRNTKVPRPSSDPSNPNGNQDLRQSRSPAFASKDASKKSVGEYSPSLSDEELNENSVAAVSAAALKKAIEQAQESIRIAKMIMEKKNEGLEDDYRPKSKGRSKIKDKKETRIGQVPDGDGWKENNVRATCERSDPAIRMLNVVDGNLAPTLNHSDNFLNAGKAKVEMVTENVEAANELGDAFALVGEKFAPSCSQSEILNTIEKAEVTNVLQNSEAAAGDGETRNITGLVANSKCRTVNLESGKVDDNDNLTCSSNKVVPCLEQMETLESRELTILQSKGPKVVSEKAESAPNSSESVQDLEKSVAEELKQCQATVSNIKGPENIAEQLERGLSSSGSMPEQVKIMQEGRGNFSISQEDELAKESDSVTDDKEKCDKKFVGHEELVCVEHLTVLKPEFNSSQNDLQNLSEKDVMELADMDEISENISEWKENEQDGRSSDEEENGMVLKEEHLWFESKVQLVEPMEEEISERNPEIVSEVGEVGTEVNVVDEPEFVDKNLNYEHEEIEQILPGNYSDRQMDTSLYEAAETVQMETHNYSDVPRSSVPQDVEEIIDTLSGAGRSEEKNQDKFEFQEAASGKDNDGAVDARSDSGTIFSESQESCDVDLNNKVEEYIAAVRDCKDNDSLPPETDTFSVAEDKEAHKQFHLEVNEMPGTDSLRRCASEENFVESQPSNTFEGVPFDSKSGIVDIMDADREETLPRDEDMFKSASEIYNATQECAGETNIQNLHEFHSTDVKVTEFDRINVKTVFERSSESKEEPQLTSVLENIDEVSVHDAKDKTSNKELKDDLDMTSNETADVGQQNELLHSEDQIGKPSSQSNCQPKEMDKSVETEREAETGRNMENNKDYLSRTSTIRQKDAKGNEQTSETNDPQQRIEAIKRGREQEKDRMAVERAVREARERAFAEAREKAERAAVERAVAEARQRVMTEARDKLEKASVETKPPADKASNEAKLRAERAAVERATAEARERALEKAMSQKSYTEARTQAEKYSTDSISNSSRNNGMKHSLSSSDLEEFGTATSESAQRRKARLERHQRIMERAANALAEKNMRDLLAQKEQAERNRLAESLDADVKRWAAGKEWNLRALLSTLQYILGADSGWQPISLTEIITTAAVKKAYRKATLCVHPDKLQQRGASIQQKYICEKVFDLLKAAWNRFNSEER